MKPKLTKMRPKSKLTVFKFNCSKFISEKNGPKFVETEITETELKLIIIKF